MPRIINVYIFKEISVPFILSVSILTVTALLSKVIKLIELMVTHGIGMSFIFWFILSVIPTFLIYTVPISFLIAVLIAFTRLSSDSELTAMKASGISLFSIIRPVLLLALLAYALTLSITLYLFPWGNGNMKKLMFEAARTRLVSSLEEKTFYDRFKGAVLYVDHLSPKTGEMEGIFISQQNPGKNGAPGDTSVFFAQKGAFAPSDEKSSLYLRLDNGKVHRKTDNNGAYHIADFSSYVLELNLAGADPGANATTDKPNRELYLGELITKVNIIRSRGESTAPYVIDLHKRFALPASVFVFALLGVPLGIQKVRAARFTGFSTALSVVLIYYVTSTAFEALGNNRVLNPVFAVWGSDIIFAIAGSYTFYMAAKDAPINVFALLRPDFIFKRRGAEQ